MSDDDNYRVGYKCPPKHTQFKKNQSGCPSGGHEQRKSRKATREQKQKEELEASLRELENIVAKLAVEKISVSVGGKKIKLSRFQIHTQTVLDAALKPNPNPATVKAANDLYRRAKLFDVKPKDRPMVLVVPAAMSEDEWAKATEGERMSKNPLEGIPGAENIMEREYPTRKARIEEQDEA